MARKKKLKLKKNPKNENYYIKSISLYDQDLEKLEEINRELELSTSGSLRELIRAYRSSEFKK